MSRIYEEMGCIESANNIIARGQKKVNALIEYEELDKPVPKHIE